MALTFLIPGKTFIVGEYLAVAGGPALLFASKPLFQLNARRADKKSWPPWHPESPAGAFLNKHADYFSNFSLEFFESYEGRGGFGASTAQFLAVYSLWLYQSQTTPDLEKQIDFRRLLEEYEKVAWNGQGTRPSGADLICQLKGSLTFVDKSHGLISVKSWPFLGLDFLLVHTGNKVATHEHLRTLQAFHAEGLHKAYRRIHQAFEFVQEEEFVLGIKDYAQELLDLGFTCEPTLKILAQVRKIPGVQAAKGCGALGADVILVVCDKEQSTQVQMTLQQMNLACLTSAEEISAGLQVKGSL